MIPALKQIQDYVLDLIFPPYCLVCGRYDFWLCPECLHKVRPARAQTCAVCELPSVNGITHPRCTSVAAMDGLASVCEFSQIQEIIHSLKYGFVRDLAWALGECAAAGLRDRKLDQFFSDFLLLPVPLHPQRLRFRGFNQSQLLAEALSKNLGLPIAAPALARFKATVPQTTLDKARRRENIRGSIKCLDQGAIRGKKILLVDDIATTGATLNECAKVLKRNGAVMVWAIVLARA